MGMDVYGKSPTSDKGAYFRNNVWWWHPLWDYCLGMHGDICGKVTEGHFNSGDGLNADDATKLGLALLADIGAGITSEYEKKYHAELAALPLVDCQWCEATGIRNDETGKSHGMPERELDEASAILFGRTHGWCNACQGAGKSASWATNYPFKTSNVQEFAEFLLDCGGFEIH